jgi:hypothetical protein
MGVCHRACGRFLDARTGNGPDWFQHTTGTHDGLPDGRDCCSRRLSPKTSVVAVLPGVYAGVLELGQMYVPGRHAALLDWLASSGGGYWPLSIL